ncbi:MAG: hypothetical protein JXB46_10555 [Candidatus Eisenbacteria bacterium]|nr:hypothetical protein [Candidatus Eisenbacteria bacterium]
MTGMLRSHGCGSRGAGANAGITTLEVLIAGFIGAIILLAAFTMYLTSIETWEMSGARLALQRAGDRAVRQIAFDIRHGDFVVISADSTQIDVTRTIGGATQVLAVYRLDGYEVKNQFNVSLTDPNHSGDIKVTSLQFWSINGTKVWISMTLEDDMGTSALAADDQRVEINSVAVCRNEAF